MAATYHEGKIIYDGDGQLKAVGIDTNDVRVFSENGEWFIKVPDDGSHSVVLYAPETDNYAASVLEFTA